MTTNYLIINKALSFFKMIPATYYSNKERNYIPSEKRVLLVGKLLFNMLSHGKRGHGTSCSFGNEERSASSFVNARQKTTICSAFPGSTTMTQCCQLEGHKGTIRWVEAKTSILLPEQCSEGKVTEGVAWRGQRKFTYSCSRDVWKLVGVLRIHGWELVSRKLITRWLCLIEFKFNY